jgi:hypothetical protein
MSYDPLVAEVRAVREAYAKRFNYDLDAIYRHLKEQEKKSGRITVSFSTSNNRRRKKAKPGRRKNSKC